MANLTRRLIWQLNRSPLRAAIKQVLRIANFGAVRKRRLLALGLPSDPGLEQLAERLEVDGYCLITERIDQQALATLAEHATAKLQRAEAAAQHQVQASKPFWMRLLDEEMEGGKMRMSSPYVRFALQPVVMQLVSRVLGQIPRLDYVLLTLSRHSSKAFEKSQLWHRDHDDLRVIKLFVYLTDVEHLDDGPFTFIPAPASSAVGYSIRSHRTDEELFASGKVLANDVKTLLAPALSVFLVDTSRCLHMGSRLAIGHQRLMYTATFSTMPSMFPGYRKERFIADIALESEVEKKVLMD